MVLDHLCHFFGIGSFEIRSTHVCVSRSMTNRNNGVRIVMRDSSTSIQIQTNNLHFSTRSRDKADIGRRRGQRAISLSKPQMRLSPKGITMAFLLAGRHVRAFQAISRSNPCRWKTTQVRSSLEEDKQGRRIRRRPTAGWGDDNDDDEEWEKPSKKITSVSDDDAWDANYTPKPRSSRPGSSRRDSWAPKDNFRKRDGRPPRGRTENSTSGSRPINMNALEGAGFVHLYGLSSVLNALHANRRDLTTVQERSIEDDEVISTEAPKPQAQFRPYLFVQERKSSTRRGQKATDAERVLALSEERNVPIVEVDKGILNTLSGNRPHQVRNFLLCNIQSRGH